MEMTTKVFPTSTSYVKQISYDTHRSYDSWRTKAYLHCYRWTYKQWKGMSIFLFTLRYLHLCDTVLICSSGLAIVYNTEFFLVSSVSKIWNNIAKKLFENFFYSFWVFFQVSVWNSYSGECWSWKRWSNFRCDLTALIITDFIPSMQQTIMFCFLCLVWFDWNYCLFGNLNLSFYKICPRCTE